MPGPCESIEKMSAEGAARSVTDDSQGIVIWVPKGSVKPGAVPFMTPTPVPNGYLPKSNFSTFPPAATPPYQPPTHRLQQQVSQERRYKISTKPLQKLWLHSCHYNPRNNREEAYQMPPGQDP